MYRHAMVLELDAGKIRDEINDLLGRNGAESFRPTLARFAKGQGIPF